MSLRKRERNWHYRFKYLGHEHTASTGLEATERNRRPAQLIEFQALQTLRNGGKPKAERILFCDAIEKFLEWARIRHTKKPNTYKRTKTSLASLLHRFEKRKVSSLSAGDVLDFIAWRSKSDIKDGTIRNDLHALSKFYRYAIKHNWAIVNPVKKEDKPSAKDSGRMHVFTDDEQRAYLNAASKYSKLLHLCLLILFQGCRPEELLSLRVEDIDFTAGYLNIVDSKSEAGKRRLKLRPESIAILRGRITGSEWVFTSETNQRRKLSLAVCDRWNARVRKDAKLFCVIYDWRHTFATRAAAAGMPLATLAKILGHNDLKTVLKYVHPSQEEQDREMEKLSGRKADEKHSDSMQTFDSNGPSNIN